jgi:hypothetical protein
MVLLGSSRDMRGMISVLMAYRTPDKAGQSAMAAQPTSDLENR